MVSYTWINASGGNWSDAANWSPNGVPGSTDSASINLPVGLYTIMLDVAEIGSLTLDAADAIVRPIGTVKLDGTLDVKAGTFELNAGQTIQSGTVIADGGDLEFNKGTFDDVTFTGQLDIGIGQLNIENGITFTGTGPEQIIIAGGYQVSSSLNFDNDQILNNVAITMGGEVANAIIGSEGTLALGATSTLISDDRSSFAGIFDNKGTVTIAQGFFDADTIDNENSFSIMVRDPSYYGISNFNNTGTLVLSNDANIYVDKKFTNSGTVTINQNSSLVIEYGLFNNTGSLTLASGGTLDLSTSMANSFYGTVSFSSGADTLVLGEPQTGVTLDGGYTATLYQFQTGSVIQLEGTGYSLSHIGDILTIKQNNIVVERFELTGHD